MLKTAHTMQIENKMMAWIPLVLTIFLCPAGLHPIATAVAGLMSCTEGAKGAGIVVCIL